MAGDAAPWPSVALGPRAQKIGSGATPRGGKEAYLDAGPFALIRSQNVHDFSFRWDGLAYIDEEQAGALDNVEVRANDILINITGDSVARVCMVDERALPARVNQHVAIIRANPAEFSQDYLLYALLEPAMKQRLLMLASAGATRNALTKGTLEELEIRQPSRHEQDRIAGVLATLDTKIDLNRQMAATLEGMARALFKSWFVDFDHVHAKAEGRDTGLPADIAALFPDSFDDEGLPKGWVWKRADEIARSVRSTADPKAMPPETPYVGLEHLPRKSLGMGNHGHAHEVESGKLYFKAGDLLFGKLRPYFHKVSVMPFEGIASSDIFVFRAKSEKYRALMYFGFSEDKFVASASGASTGTRMPRADWPYMSEQQFASDDGKVLNAFNEIALSHVTQIGERLAECRKLEQLRDALLPNLLSGELRVDDAVDSIAAA
ncbi:restriction endonuclease subunit S [Sphingobium yanoikuyae]|uniref:restriction endonuclease subunit S n=1 Tax=Sphingobium yanoikuyae TaxID=13690 RepID=UPI0028AFD385|nr:restriction endonuclease subunit S [Sphingobium yanoikuyae]